MGKLHMKGRAIQLLEEQGTNWDYEIARQIIDEYELKNNLRNRCTVRLWLIEYAANGLLETVEDIIDDGSNFGKDKLMCNYRVTSFGRGRMKDTGLLE